LRLNHLFTPSAVFDSVRIFRITVTIISHFQQVFSTGNFYMGFSKALLTCRFYVIRCSWHLFSLIFECFIHSYTSVLILTFLIT